MNEKHAKALAKLLMGEAVQSGGNHWIVVVERRDGRWAGISDDGGQIADDRESALDGIADNVTVKWFEFA